MTDLWWTASGELVSVSMTSRKNALPERRGGYNVNINFLPSFLSYRSLLRLADRLYAVSKLVSLSLFLESVPEALSCPYI